MSEEYPGDLPRDGQHTTHYLHRDHLGSVDAITDKDGNVVARMSFDAFGQRRGSANWNIGFPSDPELEPIRDVTTRGYTGHHMVDTVKLIHMGGRIYDPALGRFLSPDPNIPEPGNTQAYNRYAYVYNNPLNFTDPSGFIAKRNEPSKSLSSWFIGLPENTMGNGSFGVGYVPTETLMGRVTNSGWGYLPEKLQSQVISNLTSDMDRQLQAAMSPQGIGMMWAYQETAIDRFAAAYLPTLPQGLVDFSAGLGDGILLGSGDDLREYAGIDGNIDPLSTEYSVGFATGFAETAILTAALGLNLGPAGPVFGDTAFGAVNQGVLNVGRLQGWLPRIGWGRHNGAQFRIAIRGWKVNIGRPIRKP